MNKEIKAPDKEIPDMPTIFLAGSIENGKAEKWHHKVVEATKNSNVALYNPRRDGWDSTWQFGHSELINQIKWELERIVTADAVYFYFDPNTTSPITLLELGIILGITTEEMDVRLVVYCPKEYFRAQNVYTTCEVFGIDVYSDFDESIQALQRLI